MIKERFELSLGRIKEIVENCQSDEIYGDYFHSVAEFILLILDCKATPQYNKSLYKDIISENYATSYANPSYCRDKMSKVTGTVNAEKPVNTGDRALLCDLDSKRETEEETFIKAETYQMLCFLYSEIRGLIPYIYEYNYYKTDDLLEIITIYLELFIEVYLLFSENERKKDYSEELHEIIYWFISDNCDIISPRRISEQLDPKLDFATKIIMESDLGGDSGNDLGGDLSSDLDYFPSYLYEYGEYITENEIEVAKFLARMNQKEIDAMADTFTEGYRIGFVKASKPLDKKETVNIRYNLGFERVIKAAIKNFEKMGLKPVIYRAATLSLVKSGVNKIGYTGAIPNKQYDYDHKEDTSLYLDKDFVNRKVLVIKESYENNKKLAGKHAGPAVMEVFGEEPFSPKQKKEALALDVVGRKNQVDISDRLSQIVNSYIRGDERSFTIIAFPVPEIGEHFPEIFSKTVELNTLDYTRYEKMQQLIIDVLDRSKEVRIEGKGANRTKLRVKTQLITDATKQTVFENCVADVNIPVGEVFTSPMLKGTNGILNVSEVYLFGLNYIDLCITFKDGMISDYTCRNFENEEDNRKYIRENLLHNHETLPLGEFAIGTNTTAYRMARDFNIEERLPILIGEKTGPHFAVGDTCYSHEEDVKVYNPDGKEIIARDNELTKKYRESNPSKAYFNCHTDITIPYDELSGIYAVMEDGMETAIIEDGRFVLEGLEELNVPLD